VKRGTGNKICYVPACSNPSFKVTQVANKTTLEQLFYISSENIPPVPASNEEKGYPLCKEHYGGGMCIGVLVYCMLTFSRKWKLMAD